MCGICGIFNYASGELASEVLVKSMSNAIRHRGPDDDGSFVDGPVALGFRRLSIIDLATGHQPLANEDQTCWVTMNGEIYNYRELRHELELLGHTFRTSTDTETVVHGYEQWGPEVTSHLNGMFGFALWDGRRRQLLIARDHLGIKPVYFHDDGRRLLWGSELKAILQDPNVRREVNPEALSLFLSYGYVPSPWTLFKGIYKLGPGCRLIASSAGARQEQYWRSIPEIRTDLSEVDATETYARLLRQAVKRQMVSDVPVGVMLSGGLDSGVITAIMSEEAPGAVKTFTVGFEDEGSWNELDEAAGTSRLFQAQHHFVRIASKDYADFLAEGLWFLEEPVLSTSVVAFYYLSKLAHGYVKVALTGQGADEPLAGYARYRGERLASRIGWLVGSPLSRALLRALPRAEQMNRAARSLGQRDPLTRFSEIRLLFSAVDRQALLRPEFVPTTENFDIREPIAYFQRDVSHLDTLAQLLYVDTRTSLPDDLLLYGDKMSMANSLEARVPLLDVDLVNFIESLPTDLKLRGLTGKYIHRKACERWLPESVIKRPKKGFETPVDVWFQRSLDGFVRDAVLAPGSACSRYFETGFIVNLLDEHRARKRDHRRRIYALLSFELWHRRFIDQAVVVPAPTIPPRSVGFAEASIH